MTTSGDRLTDRPLSEAGGKGLFTKEIETALLAGHIDIGVHSAKDMATALPEGLFLAGVLEREDVRDAFVSPLGGDLSSLPEGARLGTSSIRRAAQMLNHRPDLSIVPFRGNVDTRLRKLADGVADATLLAVAGLKRLGRADAIASYLDPLAFPPAPAQGAIALQLRDNDTRTAALVAPLLDARTTLAVRAERALLQRIEGSCRTPVGVYTSWQGDTLELSGEVLSPDGAIRHTASATGRADDPEAVGRLLGQRLLDLAGPAFLERWGV